MLVKICGITNPGDAFAAIDFGATALGFIFHANSARYVEPESLKQWIHGVPAHISRVGVFVNERPQVVEAVCRKLGLDTAQLHGQETPADHPQNVRVWKAFRVTPEALLNGDYPADAILLDGPGSGQGFDWSIARTVQRPLIIAGGLDEHNVRAAIERTRPWGVDVCSSVEATPGRKDTARMKKFIEAALNS